MREGPAQRTNVEKLLFFTSSSALLLAAWGFVHVPRPRHWGPSRCNTAVPGIGSPIFKPSNTVEGFLRGSDPFARAGEVQTHEEPGGDEADGAGTAGRAVVGSEPMTVEALTAPDGGRDAGEGGRPVEPSPPVVLCGCLRVENGDTYAVFAVRGHGGYVSAKEGRRLPGLGLKVLRATMSVVTVENENHQRIECHELIRPPRRPRCTSLR